MSAALPCPFCGARDPTYYIRMAGWVRICCRGCGAQTRHCSTTDIALVVWNTRSEPEAELEPVLLTKRNRFGVVPLTRLKQRGER